MLRPPGHKTTLYDEFAWVQVRVMEKKIGYLIYLCQQKTLSCQ